MDGFLEDINYMIFIRYVYYHISCDSIREDEFGICMKDETHHCSLSFTPDKIIEFIKVSDHEPYYLHFQFINMLEAKRLFNDFLNFIHKKDKIKVLICCSSAFTSSYLAEILNDYIINHHEDINVKACSYDLLENVKEKYDHILLAPQISYMKMKLNHIKNLKTIPTNIYATYDCKKIVEMIKNEHRNKVEVLK